MVHQRRHFIIYSIFFDIKNISINIKKYEKTSNSSYKKKWILDIKKPILFFDIKRNQPIFWYHKNRYFYIKNSIFFYKKSIWFLDIKKSISWYQKMFKI